MLSLLAALAALSWGGCMKREWKRVFPFEP